MKMTKRNTKIMPRIRRGGIHKLITYQYNLNREFDGWAADCGWRPHLLRKVSEYAIRTRHHEATINHVADRANGRQPDVYCLSLGKVEVFYSVELHAAVIRGYAWELDHEPRDDFEGGGYLCDLQWHSPQKIDIIDEECLFGDSSLDR